MNQHIEQASNYLESIIEYGFEPDTANLVARLSMAESLLSIAKSLHALQLENEETKQPKENEDE